ncbi:MAG TPA: hypothetical protein VJ866_12210 [Pyrinomonadaceae bacterium]|nr:hypothetical protein [Pyrinomonadaceae bacterium]
MASENLVSYTLMKELRGKGWRILHYHPPGGQAAWGLYVSGDLIFLDILAYRDGEVVLAENKGRFNQGDVDKLERIIADELAINQVREFIRNQCVAHRVTWDKNLRFYLVHGYSGRTIRTPLVNVNLAHVSDDEVLTLTSSQINPLVI